MLDSVRRALTPRRRLLSNEKEKCRVSISRVLKTRFLIRCETLKSYVSVIPISPSSSLHQRCLFQSLLSSAHGGALTDIVIIFPQKSLPKFTCQIKKSICIWHVAVQISDPLLHILTGEIWICQTLTGFSFQRTVINGQCELWTGLLTSNINIKIRYLSKDCKTP